jgi:hypothetical protein
MRKILKCNCGCTETWIHDVKDSVAFVDAMRYLYLKCPNEKTTLDGRDKDE